jgi:hypothetical protein
MVSAAFALGATPAAASVDLGQLAPLPSGSTANNDLLQIAVTSGASYTVPENGTITSWSHNAEASSTSVTLKIYRKTRDPNFYKVIGLDGPQPLTGGKVNSFTVSIPVQAGDVLGATQITGPVDLLFSAAPGDQFLSHAFTPPPFGLGLGDEGSFTGPNAGARLNLAAVLQPSNTVGVGNTSFNKKKGTATLNLNLPNPGDLTASGKGVKASSDRGAVVSKSVGAGAVQLLVKAKGSQLKTLNSTGKVKLKVTLTYTPQNGSPGTQTVKVKLRKG